MTTSAMRANRTGEPLLGDISEVLLRSLERHLLANEELAEAFRVLTAELEVSSLNRA